MNATQKITAADISEAGIWSEGTPWNAQEIVALYRDYLGETSEPKGMAGFCESVLKIPIDPQYSIAFAMESGDFDVVEKFHAWTDQDANDYADANYADKEWFVLNATGKNINGGE